MADLSTLEPSDLLLAQKVRQGDNEAFALLSQRYKGLISSVAGRYSAAGLDRNDFLQEGLLGLLSACKFYSPERNASFRNFAALCMNRRFLSLVRKEKNKGAIPSDSLVPIEDLELSDNNSLNPETLILEKEQDEDFEKLLREKLSSLELRVLRLYLGGCSYQDIAKSLETTPKSVDNALQRIRKKIASGR